MAEICSSIWSRMSFMLPSKGKVMSEWGNELLN
jgi:hypothetical protein